jgi:3-isopropylmalate dehydrogenase
MLLRHSFQLETEAAAIESAVRAVLAAGQRTRDLAAKGQPSISTSDMGERVANALRAIQPSVTSKIS